MESVMYVNAEIPFGPAFALGLWCLGEKRRVYANGRCFDDSELMERTCLDVLDLPTICIEGTEGCGSTVTFVSGWGG